MIFGQIKLKIYAFNISDQDVKIPPETPWSPLKGAPETKTSQNCQEGCNIFHTNAFIALWEW
jgi:hypothetical protein